MKKTETTPKPLPAEFLLQREKCCGSRCHNCPYITAKGERHIAETQTLHTEFVAFIRKYPGKNWSDFITETKS